MLRMLLVSLLVFLGAFLVYVALLPAAFKVERTTTIAAPPADVFAHVVDLRKWDGWSPWAKRDPNATTTFSGPAEGKGATFAWSGNKEVGEGRMTIVDASPAERIDIRLDFTKPFAGGNDVRFDFAPQGDGTRVTWAMQGESGFAGRAVCTIVTLGRGMDAMIGGDYAKGLASLKQVVEARKG